MGEIYIMMGEVNINGNAWVFEISAAKNQELRRDSQEHENARESLDMAIAMSLSEEESRIKREEEREEEELARILALSLEEKWMANAKDIVLTDRKTIIMKEFIVTLREW